MTIGILSKTNDFSTGNVIDWLLFYNTDFVRANEEGLNHCKIDEILWEHVIKLYLHLKKEKLFN